jgi:hypothetical protein
MFIKDPNDIIWIEHYNQANDTDEKETFNLVKMEWDNRRKCYHSPNWRPCDKLTLGK